VKARRKGMDEGMIKMDGIPIFFDIFNSQLLCFVVVLFIVSGNALVLDDFVDK
jgi:hypothetical protein